MVASPTAHQGRHLTIATRIRLLGGSVDPVTPAQVIAFIAETIVGGRKAIVANHNLHSLYLLARDRDIRAFFDQADLIQIDSIPLIAWGRILGEAIERAHRSTYLDWRDDFWHLASERGWKVFLLGSAPGVTEVMIERLRPISPGVHFASHHGFFDHDRDGSANRAVVAQINELGPDVILVGMGMPVQEAWIANNVDRLRSGVLLSVGGAFDYEAGVQTPAPRWIGRVGLEWLYRFVHQPRRLFGRYFLEPWGLLGAALDDVLASSRRHDL